jgi:hypothetical protein
MDRTNAERQRRYIQRLKARAAGVTNAPAATSEIAALEQELAQAKEKLVAANARITEMGHKRAAERQAFRDEWERRAAKPKAEKPPLPPDEERDRIIKGLKTRVRNVTQELRHFKQYHEGQMAKHGGMLRPTRIAIDKVLHPEQRKHWTRAELDAKLDEACKLWNAFNDKARRQAR